MTSVDVWLAPVVEETASPRLEPVLSDAERERASRFYHPIDRAAYVTAHALVRHALTNRIAAVRPESWRFDAEPSGRPILIGSLDHHDIQFSISHSTMLVGCAVANGPGIGIDIEPVDRRAPLAVAEKYFAEGERARIAAASPGDRGPLFLRHWTLKEAYLKALGLGLSTSALSKIAFTSVEGIRPRLADGAGLAGHPEDWTFEMWAHRACYVAVAVHASATTVSILRHQAEWQLSAHGFVER